MSPKRVFVLLTKELVGSAKNFIALYLIVMPILISLLVALLFGDLFSEKPNLGYVAEADSQFAQLIAGVDFVKSKAYASETDLRQAVESGAEDIGIVAPPGFDAQLQEDTTPPLQLYVWGESLLKDQILLTATLGDLLTTLTGRESPVSVEPVILGEGETLPIQERLLPMLVLMAVILGGTMIPALSLVLEKQNRTIRALITTPASLGEVFLAKGIFGVLLSVLMAAIVLTLNQALDIHPGLQLLVLAIGASAAAAFGILFAMFVKDVKTLMAIVKALGLLLYAPGILQMFPGAPGWIAKLFPTYYMIGPITTITQEGGGWSDVAGEVGILVGITLALIAAAGLATQRVQYRAA